MSAHRSISALLIGALGIGLLPHPAEAQRRLLERAKQAAREIVAEEVLPQAATLLGDGAGLVLDDGRFFAVATPWAGEDGAATVNRATISGSAYVERAGNGFVLAFCDETERQRLVSGWTSTVPAARLAGEAAAPAARGRTRAAGDEQEAAESPFVGDYPLTSGLVRAGVGGKHVRVHGEADGSLRLTSVSDDLWIGTATMSLPAVQLGQEAESRSVQLAITFRAEPRRAGGPAPACRPPRR
jgi:hypothetical protein